MATNVRVENLPSDITEKRLKDIFSQIGEVQSVIIKTNLLTGRPRGYGFVEMSLDVDAFRAVNILDGISFKDKRIHLKEEKPLIVRAKEILSQAATREGGSPGNRSSTY